MRRPSRRLLLGLSYVPLALGLLDIFWRRRHGAHNKHAF